MKTAGSLATKVSLSKPRSESYRERSGPPTGQKGRTLFLPTPREREVLRLVWTGYSNREIAQRLGISARTIEAHRASLMKKLRVANTAQLVRVAIEQGL